MKKYLLLGILLFAGLSFAEFTPPDNWMTHVVNRYGCNWYYIDIGYGGHDSLMDIARDDEGYWDLTGMESNLRNMEMYLMTEDVDMCYWACSSYEGYPNTAAYRAGMLGYNLNSASLRAKFVAGVRNYLADGGDRAAILARMQDAMNGYGECLAYAGSESGGPCWFCLF